MEKKRESIKEIELYPNYAIMELKFWISQQTCIPELSDEVIKTFLHSCYYNVKDTKDTLTAYFSIRIRSPQVFIDRDVNVMESVIETFYFIKLPGLTEEGYEVIYCGLRHDDPSTFQYADLMKYLIMSIELLAFKRKDNCAGLVAVCDNSNFTFSHLRKTDFGVLKTVMQYFQDALPVRLKKILLLNVASPIIILLNMMQPIIAKRLIHMMEKYPKDSTEYYNIVPQRMFPLEFGGECKSIKELQDDNVSQLRENREWFQNEDEVLNNLIAKQPQKRRSIFNLFF